MALLSGGSSIPIMANEPTPPVRKPGADLIPFVALGLTVLLATFGQAAWLDGKIERLDAKLTGEIRRVDAKLTGEIRRVDAKLTSEIQRVDAKLTSEIQRVDAKLTGEIQRVDAKLSGEIQRVEDRLNIGLQNHQDGLAEVRERLVAVESGLAAAALESRVTAPGRREPS